MASEKRFRGDAMLIYPCWERLLEHPEGASSFSQDPDGSRSVCSIQTCHEFVEVRFPQHRDRGHILNGVPQLTGDAGDVILLHPFMVGHPGPRLRNSPIPSTHWTFFFSPTQLLRITLESPVLSPTHLSHWRNPWTSIVPTPANMYVAWMQYPDTNLKSHRRVWSSRRFLWRSEYLPYLIGNPRQNEGGLHPELVRLKMRW